MPDIGKTLRDEISRLAKREVIMILADTAKTVKQLKREMAELQKLAAATKKPQVSKTVAETSQKQKADPVATTTDPSATKQLWFTSEGIKSMRQRLGLSQKDFARLCKVSENAVGNWESSKNKGKLKMQTVTLEKLAKVRSTSPTAAKKILAETAAKAG